MSPYARKKAAIVKPIIAGGRNFWKSVKNVYLVRQREKWPLIKPNGCVKDQSPYKETLAAKAMENHLLVES